MGNAGRYRDHVLRCRRCEVGADIARDTAISDDEELNAFGSRSTARDLGIQHRGGNCRGDDRRNDREHQSRRVRAVDSFEIMRILVRMGSGSASIL
jgi:hypothetical protein